MSRDKYSKQLIRELAKIIKTDEDSVKDLIEKDNVVREYYQVALYIAHKAYADGMFNAQ